MDSTGVGIVLQDRSWKKGPLMSAEADWIVAEIRIPPSGLSEMSAARPSESWIRFEI